MPSSDDERFVADRLTEAANARAGAPTPEAVLRRGRRMQRRQRLTQCGLALGVVAGLALGATQVDFARAEQRDVVVAAVPTSGALSSGTSGCAIPYNDDTLAARSLAFDGRVLRMEKADKGRVRVDFVVNRWFKGGTARNALGVEFLLGTPESPPAFGPGTRLLVAGESNGGRPIAWGCGFIRYWSAPDAAVWDRAFGQSLGSPAAMSTAWCVDHNEESENRQWAEGARAAEAIRQASRVLDERYGRDLTWNRLLLRAGIIGLAGDARTGEVVVVVDPSKVSISDLAADLERGRDEARDPAAVVVRAGCRAAEGLESAGKLLDGRAWHPDAKDVDFDFRLSAGESRWVVDIPPGSAAAELKRQLGHFGLVLTNEGLVVD
ncbi:MAG: hypothetical protein ACT4QF_23245 [Sporichthyaceae bacterium]